MKQNNKNEKRKRKLRIAAGKRKERLEYREKYSTSSPQNDEWSDYNLKLESNKKKAKIWWLIAFLFTFGLFFFSIVYIRSEEQVFKLGVIMQYNWENVRLALWVFSRS